MRLKITREDANTLYGYIREETGYSEDKICRIITDYSEEILKRGASLPKRLLIKLRDKWGLSVHVGGCAFALAAATVGALHVRLIWDAPGQMQILME